MHKRQIETFHASVRLANQNWVEAFNAGDCEGCSSFYEPDGVLHVLPFGTFNGRDAIREFWKNFIWESSGKFEYIEPELKIVDSQSLILSSNWRTDRWYGRIHKEHWFLQPDGSVMVREDHCELHGEQLDFQSDAEKAVENSLMLNRNKR